MRGLLKGCLRFALLATVITTVLGCGCGALLMAVGAGAQGGVGVNTSAIDIDDPLAPGARARLPGIGVLNPGLAGRFEVVASLPSNQQGLRPPAAWLTFTPPQFALEPGGTQVVGVILQLPLNARPGAYACLLAARRISEGSGVRMQVAAATKLSFQVRPSSWWQALGYRLRDLAKEYEGALRVILTVILVLAAWRWLPIKVVGR